MIPVRRDKLPGYGVKTCLLSFVLAFAGFAVAADQEQAKNSPSAERSANSKRKQILAEIHNLKNHEWAGEYYAGDGLGVNTSLVIAPKSGYVFEWDGCMGLYDRNYGAVTFTNGRIHLFFTFENQRVGFQGIAPELIPVSWGSRRYLIPSDDVVGFCNNINEGQEPRTGEHGSYLLRRGDENKAVTGFPTVPIEYQGYLLTRPIEATIIVVGRYTTRPSAGDWKFKDTPVTLDAGKRQGLRVGMELVLTKPGNSRVMCVQVTKIEETRSEGIVTQDEEQPGPRMGWRLSTQAPWYVQHTN